MSQGFPVTVIGGYLGAGKTTLVNHLLRNAGGRRLAVLVNEFGSLPIDEDLIEAEDDALIAISGGCVCCSFGGSLARALDRLAMLDPRPDHLLIESSGVAIPGAIALTVSMSDGVRIDGIVVLAGATDIREKAADPVLGPTVERQLQDAQIVVLTKTDLVDAATLAEVTDWVSARAPQARVIPAAQGEVPLAALLDLPDPRLATSPGGHADRAFETVVIRPEGRLNPAALADALANGPYGVVRAKGFVEDRDGTPMTLQTVGAQWDVTRRDGAVEPGVVCIGLKGQLQADALRELIAGLS